MTVWGIFTGSWSYDCELLHSLYTSDALALAADAKLDTLAYSEVREITVHRSVALTTIVK